MRPTIQTNAGPMADIAFLLLVFFLVATTMNGEKGIPRKMPSLETEGTKPHAKRNTLLILVNGQEKIMVKEEIISLRELGPIIKQFVNNNGKGDCDYCPGAQRSTTSSDHPTKALLGLDIQKGASYDTYVKVQNEISSVYKEMRDELAQTMYGSLYDDLDRLKQKKIKAKYPLLLSEQVLNLN